MSGIQYIEVSSTVPYERGKQYGQQAKEKIVRGIENYKKLFEEITGKTWEATLRYANSYTEIIKDEVPDLLSEARGIADGAEVSLAEIMVLNCRYEITKFSNIPENTHECTTAAILTEASKDNEIFMVKNWDYKPGIIENIVVLHIDEGNGTKILGTAEAGQMIRDGINNHGIGLCNNNLKSKFDNENVGIPSTFLRRQVLSSKTYEQAVETSVQAKRTVSVNMLLVSDKNQAIDLEAYPTGCDFVKPINGILTHANHFVINPDLSAKYSSDFMRDTRLRYLLGKHYKTIDLEKIQNAMRDHEFFPFSLCGHDSPHHDDLMKGRATVASMIFNLSKKLFMYVKATLAWKNIKSTSYKNERRGCFTYPLLFEVISTYEWKKEEPQRSITLPFSGRIIDLRVSEGDHVSKGEELFTVEAFKLENLVFSKEEGKITKINAVVGQDMRKGEIVVELQII